MYRSFTKLLQKRTRIHLYFVRTITNVFGTPKGSPDWSDVLFLVSINFDLPQLPTYAYTRGKSEISRK